MNTDIRLLKRRWLYPLVFFQVYLAATVYLFFFGPWPWEVQDATRLVVFLGLAQVSIAVGYVAAWPGVRRSHQRPPTCGAAAAAEQGMRFTRNALFVTLAIVIPTSLSRTGDVIPDVLAGILDTGRAYNDNFERLESGNPYVMVEYLRMLLAPWLLALFPLTVVYWARMSASMRIGCVAAILANLSVYLATGTNKGLADVVVTTPWLLLLAVHTGLLRFRVSRRTLLLVASGAFLSFLVFFGKGQAERAGSVGEFGIFNTGAGILEADSGALGTLLSDNFRIIYESLTRYVAHGYYALHLALQVDHGSTYGFGHSMFLARNADMVFGTDHFTAQSLPGIVEARFGWSQTALWHSIYPWLASDVGFAGCIPVMGILGYLLSLSWGMSLTTLRYRWITLLFMMLILFFYIPANNQIFQSGETCVGFVLVVAGLVLAGMRRSSRRRRRSLPAPAVPRGVLAR